MAEEEFDHKRPCLQLRGQTTQTGLVGAIAAQVILETWFAVPAPHSESWRGPGVENGDCAF